MVTAAVFGAVTAACGLFLSLVVRDAVILWTVASALGVAMAGLAALWGKWWAGRERKHPETDHRDERANAEPGLRAAKRGIVIGGNAVVASSGNDAKIKIVGPSVESENKNARKL